WRGLRFGRARPQPPAAPAVTTSRRSWPRSAKDSTPPTFETPTACLRSWDDPRPFRGITALRRCDVSDVQSRRLGVDLNQHASGEEPPDATEARERATGVEPATSSLGS